MLGREENPTVVCVGESQELGKKQKPHYFEQYQAWSPKNPCSD